MKALTFCVFSYSFFLKLIKSPQYTGGDFMFLYRFVRRRRRPAAGSAAGRRFLFTR